MHFLCWSVLINRPLFKNSALILSQDSQVSTDSPLLTQIQPGHLSYTVRLGFSIILFLSIILFSHSLVILFQQGIRLNLHLLMSYPLCKWGVEMYVDLWFMKFMLLLFSAMKSKYRHALHFKWKFYFPFSVTKEP